MHEWTKRKQLAFLCYGSSWVKHFRFTASQSMQLLDYADNESRYIALSRRPKTRQLSLPRRSCKTAQPSFSRELCSLQNSDFSSVDAWKTSASHSKLQFQLNLHLHLSSELLVNIWICRHPTRIHSLFFAVGNTEILTRVDFEAVAWVQLNLSQVSSCFNSILQSQPWLDISSDNFRCRSGKLWCGIVAEARLRLIKS